MGVMYDGIIREVWLICDPADGQSAIPISQASPSLDAPPPNHNSGVATVVQPEPCVTLRPEPGAGKTPSAGVQVTEVCPEPANPAAVVTTPQPAPSICETNPAACVVQPKAKVIKVPLNEPAEGSTPDRERRRV